MKSFKGTPIHRIHIRNNAEVFANVETVNTDSVNNQPLNNDRPNDNLNHGDDATTAGSASDCGNKRNYVSKSITEYYK